MQSFTRTHSNGARGTYTAAPGSTLPLALASVKPHRIKRTKDKRQFPAYAPGVTSTADYINQYFSLNTRPYGKISAYPNHVDHAPLYQPLPDEPAAEYQGIDTVETIPEGEEW